MASLPHSEIDFEKTAAECGRWSERSLSVARALLVEKHPISQVAADHDMTAQQANTIRSRFYAKAEKIRLDEFRQRERPGKATIESIEPFASALLQLSAEGYTHKQLAAYLDSNGLTVTPTTIGKFLRERGS